MRARLRPVNNYEEGLNSRERGWGGGRGVKGKEKSILGGYERGKEIEKAA